MCPACALKEALEIGQERKSETQPRRSEAAGTGRRFGDYELLDQLGRGGMGVVYRAYQSGLKRVVALKMILDTKQDFPHAARRFQIEAETAARLLHPNIVRLYEFGFEEQQPFFTMEWIEGESLSRRIARGDFAVSGSANHANIAQRIIRAVELVMILARAVQYAHERGVIHRDIKPGNILIDGNGQPHLTDFGLAKLSKESSNAVSDTGSVAGTPAYMAPEQARGERLSPAADIYSLGVVLFELLTGKPPFSAPTPLETLRLITDQEPPNLAKISRGRIDSDLATICRKCLEKQPASRYGSAQEFADDLARWLKREPIRARPIGPVARMHRWTRRNPVGASFIAALLLGLITTTVLIQRVRDGRRLVEEQNDLVLRSLMARIEDFWERPEVISLPIPSEEIAVLLQLPKTRSKVSGTELRLRVSQTVQDTPMSQINRKGRGLAQLEDRLSVSLARPVLIDLMLFKPQGGKVESLIRGDSDLKRMGALPYLVAKSIEPGLIPLAIDSEPKQAAIFVRKDSGITNLAQLVGKSLAFGDDDATISFQAKAELARAGILGSDLSRWEHLQRKGSATNLAAKVSRPGMPSSHARAIIAVRNGGFDAGVGRLEYVQDFTKRELMIIHRFQSNPNFWVGSDELEPKQIRAIRQALTEEPLQIAGGPENTMAKNRFLPMDDHYFDSIHATMTNEVARFEGNRPVQSRLSTLIEQPEDDE
jgi:serine/threonine protein kinase/ABC-type phosphate/phosphonate transport system substrate-binding protein